MKDIITRIEQEGNNKAKKFSIGFHVVILLLAFFYGCPYEPEKAQARQYAVTVNFEKPIEFKPPPKKVEFKSQAASNSNKAKEKEGEMKKKADPVAKIDKKTERIEVKTPTPKPPVPKPPTPTPPVIAPPIVTKTTSFEEEEVVVAQEEVEAVEVEVEVDDAPAPEPMDVEEPVKIIKKPATKVNAGTKNTSQSSTQNGDPNSAGDGDGTGKGSQGDGKGADASGNDGDSGKGTGGTGLGEMDSSGNGIFGRQVIYRNIDNIIKNATGQSGKIVFKVCVNPKGSVIFAELNELQTTVTDRNTLKVAIFEIKGYKFEPDPKAADEECGKLSINIDSAFGIRGN